VELELRLQENLPQLMGDPGRLQQVLWNLLTNAIKFTPPGGKVTLTTTGDEKTVRFAIADTGQGIDPSFLPRLFDRFSQADASAARKHGGLGLGLSIARQLVEMHGGSISAASEGLGRGATFTVTLPASLPAAPSPPHWPPAADGSGRDLAPQPAEISLQGIRVLMVDDQLDTLEATSRILAEFGAVMTTASSAPAAIDHLRRERQHILLSDIGMPEVDGYYLIRVVRETLGLGTRDLPAIALTAFSRPEDKDRALAAGYQAHFAKPIRPEALVPVIAALARPGAAASLVSIGEA
jgi:CheY-like chemotaxis protein